MSRFLCALAAVLFFALPVLAQTPAAAPAKKADAEPDKLVREASRVTLDFKNATLADVVARLAELSGNKPFLLDDKFKDKTVTLAVKDLTYWEAVDKVADPLNLIYAQRWMPIGGGGTGMEGRLALVEADKNSKLTGYAGPAVVKVDSISKLEFLRTVKATMGIGVQDGLNLNLAYFWEDRLDPLSEEIELTKVQTPKGDSLLPATTEGRRRTPPPYYYYGAGTKQSPVQNANFNLPMPAPEVRSISELSGLVRFECGSGQREITIDDVFASIDKEIKFDDWIIVVRKVDSQNGMLRVTIEAKYKGEPVPFPTYWTAGSYGWYVDVAAGGKRVRGGVYGGMITSGGGGFRAGQGDANPRALNTTPAKKGEYSLWFQGNYEEGQASVVLVLPKFHETKEFPFTIKDIPLP